MFSWPSTNGGLGNWGLNPIEMEVLSLRFQSAIGIGYCVGQWTYYDGVWNVWHINFFMLWNGWQGVKGGS